MKRLLMIVLVAVMLTACLAPMAMAETPEGAPGLEDMRGFGAIARPRQESWLSAYETRYVQSSGGVAAFLFVAPRLDADKLDPVLDGTELLLLAEQDGFYLAKMDGHRLGWICVGQTAEDTALLDSVPDLTEGVWIYERGPGEGQSFALKFREGRRVDVVKLSDETRCNRGWILSQRRILIDDLYLIWDGEQFVSRDEYWTREGKLRYTLRLDEAGQYANLFES